LRVTSRGLGDVYKRQGSTLVFDVELLEIKAGAAAMPAAPAAAPGVK
jgi:hypothetical protein